MINICPRCMPLMQRIFRVVGQQCSPTKYSQVVLQRSGKECSFVLANWISRSYSASTDENDTEPEEFGKLAERKGVSVFKLPPELRLPKEKDEDEKPKPRFFGKYTPYWYFLQCKKLAKQNKTQECLDFFEKKMLKEDGIFPEEFNYSVVIGALGRSGQVKKAFQLYKQMRQRAITPSVATYTGLFNAVAQCSNSKELRRATLLYAHLHKNKIRISRITYNSLIKVFGRHGTIEQMIGIFRESITAGFEPDSETFNMIFLSLLKDKDAGFRKAIEVWRQMLMLGVKPDGKSIMYLLKVMKNCGIGDPDVAYRKLIAEVPDPAEYKDFFKKHVRNVYWLKGQKSTPRTNPADQLPPPPEIITLEAGIVDHEPHQQTTELSEKTRNITQNNYDDVSVAYKPVSEVVLDATISLVPAAKFPNLLRLPFDNISSSREGNGSSLPLEIRKCDLPLQRLALVGGYEHILNMFEEYDIKPTVMVLSSLVQVLPPSRRAENDVVEFAEKNRLQLDADFFNAILRKRGMRRDHLAMQEILSKMVAVGIAPNYRTWCVSAISCTKGHHGVALMNEAMNANVELDDVFFNTLVDAALRNKETPIKGYKNVKGYDYRYLARILLRMQDLNIKANRRLITSLESASDWPEGYERWKLADTEFEQKVFKFRKMYNKWLNSTEIVSEEDVKT